jgi:hypothetical protein
MTGPQLVVLTFLVLVLPVVAALAWWLRRRYTAAVVRFQADRHPGDSQRADPATFGASDSGSAHAVPRLLLRIQSADEIASRRDGVDRSASPRRLRRRVLLVHFVSELSYMSTLAIVMVGAVAGSNVLGVLGIVWPTLLPFVLIPPAVASILQAGLSRRLMGIASAIVVVSGLGLLWSEAGWQSSFGFSLGYASITLLLSAFLRPSIRGAGVPLVAAATVGWLVFSALFAIALTFEGSSDQRSSSADVFVGLVELLLMLAAAVWCSWRTLSALSVRYAAKRFSDVQLALGTYWTLLTGFVIASVVRDPFMLGGSIRLESIVLVVVILWLLWRRLQAAALQRAVKAPNPSIGALLFLRVFKPSTATWAFADRFFAYWRFAAPVWLIAGPDLAGAHMEPNEFFTYLRGGLREQFTVDPSDAGRRVDALDGVRDPDGRFRVNEVHCTNDTWRPTVLEMMRCAGVIFLDLRQYSERRRGMRYELTEVLRRAPLHKVMMLVDADEDMARLRAEVDDIWADVGGCRVDVAETVELCVVQFRKGSNAEMQGLFRAAASKTG